MTPEQTAARILEERHGLRFEGVVARRLERALQAAAGAAGRPVEAHAAALRDDPAAVADLVDRTTLAETSWFRDPALFAAVLDHAAHHVSAAGRATLWSVGCAHGQEPYSLAIGLLERDLQDFEVLATDVAPAAVASTARATYSDRALRGLSRERRARWLEPAGDGLHRVREEARRHVRVRRHGLANEPPPVAAGSCAVVLCRNVLIYLVPHAVERALERLRCALAPGGVLVLGAGEAAVRRVEGLRPVPLGPGFAYVRGDERPAAPERAREPLRPSPPPVDRLPVAAPPAPSALTALMTQGETASAAGDHAAAAAAFRHAAALDPGAPLAHFGLGVALEALGDPGAVRAFRAALAALEASGGAVGEDLGGFTVGELARMLAERATETPR